MAAEIGANALALAADVTSRAEMEAAVARMAAAFGDIDVFVNNAGWIYRNKPMLEVTEEEFDKVYAINVKSIYHISNIIVPMMRKNGGGSIINIGSVAGIRPRPGLTWYNSTKGAVNILSARRWRRTGTARPRRRSASTTPPPRGRNAASA